MQDNLKIIKRRGRQEIYDERKVYASIYAASLNAHLDKTQAEKIASSVVEEINAWVSDKREVSSEEIFREVTRILSRLNQEVSFLYETHRDVA